jgi:hypothetical protein
MIMLRTAQSAVRAPRFTALMISVVSIEFVLSLLELLEFQYIDEVEKITSKLPRFRLKVCMSDTVITESQATVYVVCILLTRYVGVKQDSK